MPSPKRWYPKPHLLLLPNIPLPLHGINPRTVLGGKWWNKERKAAYARTEFHCEACGVHKLKLNGRKILEGHEVYDIDYTAGRSVYRHTVPLCPRCHQYIHDGRLLWLLETQVITYQRYAAVLRHGDAILRAAGLRRPTLAQRDAHVANLASQGLLAPWHEWRLVVDNQEFGPKYATAEEQRKIYDSAGHGDNRNGFVAWMPPLSGLGKRRRT